MCHHEREKKASRKLGSYLPALSICLFCCAKLEYYELRDLLFAEDCTGDAGTLRLAWWDPLLGSHCGLL